MADSADPFDTLKNFRAPDAGAPLPAAEVRARGDRMRRRRTAFRAVAAAAAVAVVTTGGVALGGQLSGAPAPLPPATQAPSSPPTATEQPSVAESDPPEQAADWVTEIPEDFPLALGYPADDSEDTNLLGPAEDVPVFEELRACDVIEAPWANGDERLGVLFTAPEDTRARLLTTFATGTAAARILGRYESTLRACPREDIGSGTAVLIQVREVEPGDDGFVAIRTYEQDGLPVPGLELIYGVRVGNAILLQSTYNEGGGNEKLIYADVRQQTQVVAELAEAMCLFSREGCPSSADDARSDAAEDPTRTTFGPQGFAGVWLGMSLEEANASGANGEPFHGGDCAPLSWHPEDGSPEIVGTLQRGLGVVTVTTTGPATTPEGITPESTLQEVQAAYPEGEWFDPTYVTPVPGFDDRQYSFTFAGGEATGILSMGLHLRTQSCAPNVSGTSSAP